MSLDFYLKNYFVYAFLSFNWQILFLLENFILSDDDEHFNKISINNDSCFFGRSIKSHYPTS